jgi:hypothetical protein
MATVTPNFNWPVPTSTDLVKDGATAIEALGDSIDASLVDLKGGTTGQVLSKNSNTDMDFTWVTDAAGDITGVTVTSPLTGGGTSGTVTVGILNGTTSNLGAVQLSDSVSSTSTTLAATANAVKQAYDLAAAASGGSSNVAGKNGVLNSQFNVWQRGTSVSIAASSSGYSADRWFQSTGANQACTVSRQATGDTTNLPFIQYGMRFQRNSGQTGTGAIYFSQSFETINSVQYAGKTVTLSFYARAGANYSATSNALPFYIASGTGTDQNVGGGGFTGVATVATTTATLTTSWQRFSVTGTVSSSATQLAIYGIFTPTGTAGANDYFDLTGVQLEIAGSASAYSPNTSTYQAELSACQRYYWRSTGGTFYSPYAQGIAASASDLQGIFQYPVTMRSAPSSIEFSNLGLSDGVSAPFAVNALVLANNTAFSTLVIATVTSGLTTYRYYQILNNNSTAGYFGLSAEL